MFNVIAPLTNGAWLFGSVIIAVSLKRAGTVRNAVAVGLPLAWVATIPLATLGGGVLSGAYYLAIGYLLATGTFHHTPSAAPPAGRGVVTARLTAGAHTTDEPHRIRAADCGPDPPSPSLSLGVIHSDASPARQSSSSGARSRLRWSLGSDGTYTRRVLAAEEHARLGMEAGGRHPTARAPCLSPWLSGKDSAATTNSPCLRTGPRPGKWRPAGQAIAGPIQWLCNFRRLWTAACSRHSSSAPRIFLVAGIGGSRG